MPLTDANRIIVQISHNELISFLRKQIGWKTTWGQIYWSCNLILTAVLIYLIFSNYIISHSAVSFELIVARMGLGFFLFVFLIPLHELIHGLAYRGFGAKKVVYKAIWKKMIFYAVADRFIIGYKQFKWVALAPFILINSILLALFWLAGPETKFVFYGALILHTGGCFGDFALVSYMHQNRHLNLATMDELTEECTYFFEQL